MIKLHKLKFIHGNLYDTIVYKQYIQKIKFIFIIQGVYMKRIICMSGDLASGKSAVSRIVAEQLNYELFSAGRIFRQLAEEKGISVLELNKLAETNEEIDTMIDSKILEIGLNQENIILDSRMAWHFVKNSFKVYLSVEKYEAAKRVLQDIRGTSEKYNNIDEALDGLAKRREEETKRYLRKYGVDINNMTNYQLVVDTTYRTAEEVAGIIVSGYERCLNLE